MAFNPDDILAQRDALKVRRHTFDYHWERVADLVWPDMADFITKQRTAGEKRQDQVFDATASAALEKFAAALESLLTPRAQRWHSLRTTDRDLNDSSAVKEFFERSTDVLFQLRGAPRAGFYSAKHVGYKSLGCFGNECLFVDEPEDGRSIRYTSCYVGDVYIAVNHHGIIDTIYRDYTLTPKAAHQRWANKEGATLPDSVMRGLEDKTKMYEPMQFCHVVRPRTLDYDPERADALGMQWESAHLALTDKAVVDEGGYHEMPYMFSRYTVNSVEDYGRGPGMTVLPAIETANEMQKTFLRAGHMVVHPPLLVYHDGILGQGSQSVTLRPGEINYQGLDSQGRQMIQPLQTGARLDLTEGMLEKERAVINDAFLVTLFQILVETPTMTATEALMRAQEKGQLIAPTVGRQQSEMLGPLVNREFQIAARMGLLPPLPGELAESTGDYEIVYESPSQRMQRSEELVGVSRTVEMALPFAQMDPKIMLKFDAEKILELAQEINGAPVTILHDKETYAQMRQQIEEAEAQAQQLEQATQAAPALQQLAQAGGTEGQMGPAGGI